MSKKITMLSYVMWIVFTLIAIGVIVTPKITKRLGSLMGDEKKSSKKIMNYSKLYGHWLSVAMPNTGDTIIADYYKDTLDISHCYSILSFDSTGEWSELQGDVGLGGRYKVDSLNNTLVLLSVNEKKDDTILVSQILYLGKRCLFLQNDSNKNTTQFFLRTNKVMVGIGG